MSTNGAHYEVSISGAVRQRLQELKEVAEAQGNGPAFVEAFKAIVRRLQTDPNEFGEPTNELNEARLTKRIGIIPPLAVDYGVHWSRPVVFLTGLRYLG